MEISNRVAPDMHFFFEDYTQNYDLLFIRWIVKGSGGAEVILKISGKLIK